MLKRTLALLGAAAAIGLPAIVLLPGCSGGSSSNGSTNAPTPLLVSAPLVLSPSQTASLNLTRTGTQANGVLTVNAPLQATVRGPAAFNFTIPAGSYQLTGTYSSTGTFSLTGNITVPQGNPIGEITLDIVMPTANQAGTYTLTARGQTATGVLPPSSLPNGGGNGGGNNNVTGTLTFSNVSGNFNGTSTANLTSGQGTAAVALGDASSTIQTGLSFSGGNLTRTVNLTIFKAGSIAEGETFTLSQVGTVLSQYLETNTGNFSVKSFAANGGQVKVVDLGEDTVTLEFLNANYIGVAGGTIPGQGSFVLNGTVTVPIAGD